MNHLDPFQITPGVVNNYFAELFEENLQYRTTDSYRSAISAKTYSESSHTSKMDFFFSKIVSS